MVYGYSNHKDSKPTIPKDSTTTIPATLVICNSTRENDGEKPSRIIIARGFVASLGHGSIPSGRCKAGLGNGSCPQFWREKKQLALVHERDIRFGGEIHDNKMERLNGEIRDREKVVRGVKKSNSPLIEGYQIYHNYIRPHMALENQTPADLAGITVQGENKWITLIQNASRKESKK